MITSGQSRTAGASSRVSGFIVGWPEKLGCQVRVKWRQSILMAGRWCWQSSQCNQIQAENPLWAPPITMLWLVTLPAWKTGRYEDGFGWDCKGIFSANKIEGWRRRKESNSKLSLGLGLIEPEGTGRPWTSGSICLHYVSELAVKWVWPAFRWGGPLRRGWRPEIVLHRRRFSSACFD